MDSHMNAKDVQTRKRKKKGICKGCHAWQVDNFAVDLVVITHLDIATIDAALHYMAKTTENSPTFGFFLI